MVGSKVGCYLTYNHQDDYGGRGGGLMCLALTTIGQNN